MIPLYTISWFSQNICVHQIDMSFMICISAGRLRDMDECLISDVRLWELVVYSPKSQRSLSFKWWSLFKCLWPSMLSEVMFDSRLFSLCPLGKYIAYAAWAVIGCIDDGYRQHNPWSRFPGNVTPEKKWTGYVCESLESTVWFQYIVVLESTVCYSYATIMS